MPFLEALAHLGMGHVRHAQGDTGGAREHAEQARRLAEEAGLGVLRFPCASSAAHFAFARDDTQAGRAYLRDALQFGRAHGHAGAYWWRVEMMAQLCQRALHEGIEPTYVRDLIRRRDLPAPAGAVTDDASWPWRLKLYTLGRFSLLIDDKPVHFERKAQSKPMELLLALIALGGREVAVSRLADALWPDSETPADLFKVTLARLRHDILPDPALLQLRRNRLSLDERRCWVDVWACERRLHALETALKTGDAATIRSDFEAARVLYHGPFLRDDDAPWIIAPRERLHRRMERASATVGAASVIPTS